MIITRKEEMFEGQVASELTSLHDRIFPEQLDNHDQLV